ncbi:MAG: C25 family cysteine peptidase, partial [Myxococcota bacterium]
LVMTNPADTEGWFSPPHLSLLAPLFALTRKAPLILSEGSPADMERNLATFEADHGPVTHVTLVGDYLALQMREMLDPDQVHEGIEEPRSFKIPALIGLEELEPAEYAVGRLAAEDVHDLSLQVGRILAPRRALGSSRRPALMLANADEIFIMAELVSQATVREMENAGWDVSAHYSESIDRSLIFEEMPGKEVVIWTGHPRDLTVDYDIGVVDQILDASLVFLQGCYTLDRNDPYVLVQQGAAAIIGTYMAVYSASGSAFAKTVIDSMLYHGADQGEAMVHARNYLLAYVEMKRRRGHSDWRKTWRAGLSFELWGDPTARTVPPRRRPRVPPVRLVRDDDDLRFEVPEDRFGGLSAGIYTLETPPGGQVGSIYRRSDEWGDERRMQPFYFGWVELPEMQARPSLETEIPDDMWVPLWSEARSRLYLMVHNRAEQEVGREGLVFRIVEEQVAEPGDPASEEQPETAATSGED